MALPYDFCEERIVRKMPPMQKPSPLIVILKPQAEESLIRSFAYAQDDKKKTPAFRRVLSSFSVNYRTNWQMQKAM